MASGFAAAPGLDRTSAEKNQIANVAIERIKPRNGGPPQTAQYPIITFVIVPPIVFLIVSIVLWQLAGAGFMTELLGHGLLEILPAAVIETGKRWLGPPATQRRLFHVAVCF